MSDYDFRSRILSQCLYQTSQGSTVAKNQHLWSISGRVACFNSVATLGTLFWTLGLLIFYSSMIFFFQFQRDSRQRNLGTDHRIVQMKKQFLWPVWTNIIYLRSDSFAQNCLPRLPQKASCPPTVHSHHVPPAYVFCAIVCYKPTLLFWTRIWDSNSRGQKGTKMKDQVEHDPVWPESFCLWISGPST